MLLDVALYPRGMVGRGACASPEEPSRNTWPGPSAWAGPRNGSTALMCSFAQRPDTRVLDEPLFAHFLKHTGVTRPSRDEVLSAMPASKPDALATLVPAPSDEVLFLKHMANHLEGMDWEDWTDQNTGT